MGRRIASVVSGAVGTAVIPLGYGVADWRLIAGAAVIGAVGGFFGVNVARRARQALAMWKKKAPSE